MSKPTWDEAPPWANWLAMDGPDPESGVPGFWFWYSRKPRYDDYLDLWVNEDVSECRYLHEYRDPTGFNAKDTLEERPK